MSDPVYTVGGAVHANRGTYIRRAADETLLSLCLAGQYAYVLAPRQMGKTSMMVRAASALNRHQIRTPVVDLNVIGEQTTADEWYCGFLDALASELSLDIDVIGWWDAHAHFSPVRRLVRFVVDVVLQQVPERIVIFLDEIDTTLRLPFADDFWSALRSLYDARARHAALNQLSFVFIGVVSPSDLIRNTLRTPFNIGSHVVMTDFSFAEARPLINGFPKTISRQEAEALLRVILRWTRGHPYLTQRLCSALVASDAHWSQVGIAMLVRQLFFGANGIQDPNLAEVQRMLLQRSSDQYAVLTTYRAILRSRRVPDQQSRLGRQAATASDILSRRLPVRDDPQSPVMNVLKLSGAVRSEHAQLVMRNPIYRRAFDERWIKEQLDTLPTSWQQRFRRIRLQLAVASAVALLLVSVIIGAFWLKAQAAEASAVQARDAEASQRKLAEGAALAMHAQAMRFNDRTQSLSILLAAADRGAEAQVDQVVRQIKETDPCAEVNREVYAIAWNAAPRPVVLVPWDDIKGERRSKQVRLREQRGLSPTLRGDMLSPDGAFVFRVPYESVPEIIDLRDGSTVYQLGEQSRAVRMMKWSADSSRLLLVSDNGVLTVWDKSKPRETQIIRENQTDITAIAWKNDHQYLAVAHENGTVDVLNIMGDAIRTLPGANAIESLAWNSSGEFLAASEAGDNPAEAGAAVVIWNMNDPQQESRRLVSVSEPAKLISWSPDSRYLLTVQDTTARVWDLSKQSVVTVLEKASPLLSVGLWHPDGTRFMLATQSGEICTYMTLDRLLKLVQEEHIQPPTEVQVQHLIHELLPSVPTPNGTRAEPTRTTLPLPPTAAPSETPTATPTEMPTEQLVPTNDVAATELAFVPATPTNTSTETPTPTSTDTPTPSVTPSATSTLVPSKTPTRTPVRQSGSDAREKPSGSPTDTSDPNALPTDTPDPNASPTDTPDPNASPTDTPDPNASPTDTPDPNVLPTDTPVPTAVSVDTPVPEAAPTATSALILIPTDGLAPTP